VQGKHSLAAIAWELFKSQLVKNKFSGQTLTCTLFKTCVV